MSGAADREEAHSKSDISPQTHHAAADKAESLKSFQLLSDRDLCSMASSEHFKFAIKIEKR